ncbi:MAG: HAD-IIIA family hydrolase [Spartobacteria bacterium]|nr:HAD-IIIA family hydrolase [Spartobacteria bacterium]
MERQMQAVILAGGLGTRIQSVAPDMPKALIPVEGMNQALFVDRDGVLNEMFYDADHGVMDSPRRPEQVRPMKGAGAFLKQVKAMGYLVVVVTNQPGIAKGTLTEEELRAVNDRLAACLAEEGGGWDDLFYCPHHPEGGPWKQEAYVRSCACRKPRPGMLLEAAKKHEIDLAASWMIGDGLTDVQAGIAAGCHTILYTTLKINFLEKYFELTGREPEVIVADFDKALDVLRKNRSA